MALYNIKSITTGKTVAFTTITSFDSDWASDDEILEINVSKILEYIK